MKRILNQDQTLKDPDDGLLESDKRDLNYGKHGQAPGYSTANKEITIGTSFLLKTRGNRADTPDS